MTTCEYSQRCDSYCQDDICLELSENCKIKRNIRKFRVKISGWDVEAEVLEQIDMNGYISNPRFNEGKVL